MKRSTKNRFQNIAAGTIVAVALGGFFAGAAALSNLNEQVQVGCEVDDKDRSTDKDGKSVYQVYTDCGVFRVEDNLIRGVFNSANIYGDIEVGETYDFTTLGYRLPVFSSFPTIIKVVEV